MAKPARTSSWSSTRNTLIVRSRVVLLRRQRQPGDDLEPALGRAARRSASRRRRRPARASRVRPWPGPSSAIGAAVRGRESTHPHREPAVGPVQTHGDLRTAVLAGVGQPLLDDPVRGQRHQRRDRAELDRGPSTAPRAGSRACSTSASRSSRSGCGRAPAASPVGPQQTEQVAHLAQRLAAGGGDLLHAPAGRWPATARPRTPPRRPARSSPTARARSRRASRGRSGPVRRRRPARACCSRSRSSRSARSARAIRPQPGRAQPLPQRPGGDHDQGHPDRGERPQPQLAGGQLQVDPPPPAGQRADDRW